MVVTVLSKSVLNFTAWITFSPHSVFFYFLPASIFYYLHYLSKELGPYIGLQMHVIAVSFSQSLRIFFYYLYHWAHPELAVDDVAQKERSKIPFHF